MRQCATCNHEIRVSDMNDRRLRTDTTAGPARATRALAFLSLALPMLLAACGGESAKIMGLSQTLPDEFAVVSRAPLTMPPNFGLRPPDPQGKRTQDMQPRIQAENVLFGADLARRIAEHRRRAQESGATPGELVLLERTGALSANPAIRGLIESETAAIAREKDGFIRKLVFWQPEDRQGDIIDSDAEQRRIEENAALGLPTTEGSTPIIRREEEEPLIPWPF